MNPIVKEMLIKIKHNLISLNELAHILSMTILAFCVKIYLYNILLKSRKKLFFSFEREKKIFKIVFFLKKKKLISNLNFIFYFMIKK